MTTRLRTQQIIIDLPRSSSEPWINLVVQRVELDDSGNEINVVDRWGSVNKRLSLVASEISNYTEIVPELNDKSISVYGISSAMTCIAVNWIVEKYGGTITSNGDIEL